MLAQFEFLFFPHQRNNHKPKVLHNSSLTFFIGFIICVQLSFNFIAQAAPGVLGITSTITPEEIILLTNQEREKKGLSPLRSDPQLIEAAAQKAADMLTLDYWAHNSPMGKQPWWFIKNTGYAYLFAGENLARDFTNSGSVVNAWMNSATHKENIVNSRYQDVGVAVVEGIFQGKETTLVVQMFGKKGTAAMLPETLEGSKTVTEVLAQEVQVKPGYYQRLTNKIPIVSSFEITKAISLVLLTILLVALIVDFVIIEKKKIFRISGKSLVHLLFLAIMAAAVLFSQQGAIL